MRVRVCGVLECSVYKLTYLLRMLSVVVALWSNNCCLRGPLLRSPLQLDNLATKVGWPRPLVSFRSSTQAEDHSLPSWRESSSFCS